MSKIGWFAAVAVVISAGCAKDTSNLERKVDDLAVKLAAIDQKLGAIGAGGARGGAPAKARRPEPDKDAVFAVPIANLPARGKADALVTVVEGYEYACPACSQGRKSVADILEKYGENVRVVYKPFVVHPDTATDASLAACAAHEQGKFEAMDPLLWDRAFGGRDFSAKNIEAIAALAGLDMKRYAADVAACKETIRKHQTELAGFGQGATPTFFINGRYVLGASPEKLQAVIDQELALAKQRVAEGTPRADYYKTWVLDKGLKKFEPPKAGT
jgi:protein-disulfide isomerase